MRWVIVLLMVAGVACGNGSSDPTMAEAVTPEQVEEVLGKPANEEYTEPAPEFNNPGYLDVYYEDGSWVQFEEGSDGFYVRSYTLSDPSKAG